jgi:hypothetical protein
MGILNVKKVSPAQQRVAFLSYARPAELLGLLAYSCNFLQVGWWGVSPSKRWWAPLCLMAFLYLFANGAMGF